MALEHLPRQRVHRRVVAQVAGDGVDRRQLPLQRVQRFGAAGDGDHGAAAGGEALDDGAADPARGAGDQGDAHSGPGCGAPASGMPARWAVRRKDSVIIAMSCAQNSFSRGLYSSSPLAATFSQTETTGWPSTTAGS